MEFDPVLHGLEEGLAAFDTVINVLYETEMVTDEMIGYAESARDNLGTALKCYKSDDRSCIIAGNLTEGFTIYGPYPTFDHAADSGDGAEVWVTRLHTPEQAEFDL